MRPCTSGSSRPLPFPPPHPLSFLVSAHAIASDPLHLFINIVILAVLIIAKVPELHGVRLFGVNKAHVE